MADTPAVAKPQEPSYLLVAGIVTLIHSYAMQDQGVPDVSATSNRVFIKHVAMSAHEAAPCNGPPQPSTMNGGLTVYQSLGSARR